MAGQRAFVACLVVAAAGCGAAPFADPAPATSETVTPVSLAPAATTEPEPAAALPPGVSDAGRLQTARLQRAHDAALAGTTYTLVVRQRITLSDGETVTRRSLRRVAVGETATLVTAEDANGSIGRSLYLNGSEGYQRSVSDGRVAVTAVDPTEENPGSLGTRAIRWYLSDIEFTVTPVTRGGDRLYRLYSPPGRAPTAVTTDPRVKTRVWNYTATAYVTPAGLVRTMVVDYELSSERLRGSVSIRVDTTAVGTTTVTAPEWVPAGVSTPDPASERDTPRASTAGR